TGACATCLAVVLAGAAFPTRAAADEWEVTVIDIRNGNDMEFYIGGTKVAKGAAFTPDKDGKLQINAVSMGERRKQIRTLPPKITNDVYTVAFDLSKATSRVGLSVSGEANWKSKVTAGDQAVAGAERQSTWGEIVLHCHPKR